MKSCDNVRNKEGEGMERLYEQARSAIEELIEIGHVKAGQIVVIGCSSSECVGGHIGKDSSMEAAKAIYNAVAPVLKEHHIYLAAQCCEHLNRALIIEREAAEKYGYEEVNVVPQPHAGGSWAVNCYQGMSDPVAVEHIKAHAGLDIGGTLIGMHLKDVAVPVRLHVDHIGKAILLAARTRAKYIGGERAHYYTED